MSTRRALAYSLLDRYASEVLAVIAIVVLSRLLTPREIGLFAVTMIFVSLLGTLRDFGAGQYLVQVREITTDTVRAVWTVQLGMGVLLAVLVLLVARPATLFFGEPRVESIMQVVALTFAITPFGSITYAWLTREMAFGKLAAMRFCGALAGTVVPILLALQGHGAMSLAWGHVAGAAATALASTACRPRALPWRPGRRGLRDVVGFGTRSTLYAVLQTIRVEAPLFFLGRLHEVAAVGLFSRANGFMNIHQAFLLRAVHSVTLPLFSRIERAGGDVGRTFVTAVTHTTALGWAFALAAALLADPCIRIFYGEQWLDAVPLLRVLALAGGLGMPLFLCAQVFISKGMVATNVRNGALSTVATIACVLLAAPAGAVAVAWASVAAMAVTVIVWSASLVRVVALPRGELAAGLARSAVAALGANVAPVLVLLCYGASPPAPGLAMLLAVPGGLVGFVLTLRLTGHPLYGEIAAAMHTLAVRQPGRRGRQP
ncbi:MAG: oligosaccharide flippase family protein [Gammaproteobacteria bacterium]